MNRFINKISIKYRLVVMICIPLVGLIYFSGNDIINKTIFSSNINQIQTLTNFSVKASALVHELQKERGASAGFLGSKGKKFTSELPAQHQSTNEKLSEFQAFIKNFKPELYGKAFEKCFNDAITQLNSINTIRSSVLSLNIQNTKAIGYYTTNNRYLLNAISEVAKMSTDAQIALMYNTYSNFLNGKERAGIERAVLSNVFAAGVFKGDLFNRFSSLVSEQNTYFELFYSTATDNQKIFYENLMSDPAVQDVERMRKIAFNEESKKAQYADLLSLLGYNEFIHNYKDYLIHGNDSTLNKFNSSRDHLSLKFKEYLEDPNITSNNKTALLTIKKMVDGYQKAFLQVQKLKNRGRSASEIAKLTRVDDQQAIEALKKLTNSDFGIDPVYWFNTITKKINLLKQVENRLSEDLLFVAGNLQSGIQIVYLVTGLVLLFTILIGVYLTRNIQTVLINLVQNISLSSDQLASASEEISKSSQMLSQGATEQAASLEETSSSMEQISKQTRINADSANLAATSMKSIADNVEKSNQHSQNAASLSEEAYESAENGVKAMGDISKALSLIQEDSLKITDIIEVINEITHQTKMLATNAAIEAARAGEQGKGFAVVADEVSKLAENSKTAAKEISGLIKESVKRVQGGAELSNAGETVLQNIFKKSHEVAELMKDIMRSAEEQSRKIQDMGITLTEIENSSEEQAKGINQVSLAIIEMDQVTQSNAANSEETASASEELSAQAESLRDLIKDISRQIGIKKTQQNMNIMEIQPIDKHSGISTYRPSRKPRVLEFNQLEAENKNDFKPSAKKIPLRGDFEDF